MAVSDSTEEFYLPRLSVTVSASDLNLAILYSFQKLGYDKPTEEQGQAVREFLLGKDVFVILPTGSGKSLCFVVLPLVYDYLKLTFCAENQHPAIAIVVSPLVALMKDQVRRYSGKVKCAFIGDEQEDDEVKAGVLKGEYQLVYASPELLLVVPYWRNMLSTPVYKENLVGLVVDEAHCVQTWGCEFRTEYANIAELRSIASKDVGLMALSATVSPETKEAVMENLCMTKDECAVIEKLPDKPNIKYVVRKKPEELSSMLQPVMLHVKENGTNASKTIIFCRTYHNLIEVLTCLVNELHIHGALYVEMPDGTNRPICDMYSTSTDEKVKNKLLEEFTDVKSPLRVIVATIAFGMGLDAPDIHRCIHCGPSNSIEAYVQETGRCGRDGEDAVCMLFYDNREVSKASPISDTMRLYCGNSGYCRRKLLMREFGGLVECPTPAHKCCDVCEQECG